MITLGEFKNYYATGTVNQALRGANSPMGSIVHWVVTDIISTAEFWWNRGSDSFATVNGTAEYFLNNKVQDDKVWGMYDQTNNRKLFKKDLSFFYDVDPTPTDTGTSGFWAYVGQSSCQAVPTVAGTLSIVSSLTSDTQRVVIRGKSSGIEQYEVVTLNGTNSVTSNTSWDANAILSINLESSALGLVTATRGAITVAQIPPGQLRVLRSQVRLFSVPGAANTIQYFFYKRSLPLVNDYEIVDLPDIAFKALRYGVEEICYFLTGKLAASESAFRKYDVAVKELISKSERDISGNEIKEYKTILPFSARIPDTISATVDL